MKYLTMIKSYTKGARLRLPGNLILFICILLIILLSNPISIFPYPDKDPGIRKPFIFPLHGEVALGFREKYLNIEKQTDYRHTGIDIVGSPGDRISASGNGIVVYTGFSPIGGRTIVIRHNMDIRTTYLNLQNIYVSEGDRVKQGDTIASIGAFDDPSCRECHLHFAIIYINKYLDPLQILDIDYTSISRFIRLVHIQGDLQLY
jgi:murein DD-endopeptidase MepM/ murein hydrolase activator NlpD